MRDKEGRLKRKFTCWLVLLLVSGIVLTGMIAFNGTVSATYSSENDGDRRSLYSKLAYTLFERELKYASQNRSWNYQKNHILINDLAHHVWEDYTIRSSVLKNSDWFRPKGGGEVLAGALMEAKIGGHFDDTVLWYGESDNYLMKTFVDNPEYLNLKAIHKEIICNGKDERFFLKGSIGDSCAATYDNPDGEFMDQGGFIDELIDQQIFYSGSKDIKTESYESDYLDKLVAKNSFNSKVPGGSLYKLTDLETYFLYYDTFTNVCAGSATDIKDDTYEVLVPNASTGKLEKKFFFQLNKPKRDQKIIIAELGKLEFITKSCDDLVATLNDKDSDEVKAFQEYVDTVGIESVAGEPENAEDDRMCYDNSGALGWVICPLIQAGSEIASYMYNEIETDFLQLKVGKMFEQDGGLEMVWRMFRDMANVIFIIFFLAIIFSQLTGIGIDNYGIKKILPKLIVVAIVMNLSFLLCALAADVSNIMGIGLNQMFTSMAEQIDVTTVSPTVTGSIAAGGLIGGGVVLFVILTNPIAAVSFAGVAVAVCVAVFGIVISLGFSIFFMYLALMVRNMGIILLIAVSPVAIVCYMLPNMDKISKKWFELLKALLMIYPICGALIGGGKLAGRLLASFDTPAMVVAGMIVEVVPFFMLPKILKSSLQLMDNIGMKLSNAGRNLGGRASVMVKGKISGSNRYQDWAQFNKSRAIANSARRTRDSLAKRRTLTEAQRNRFARAQHTVAAYESDREKMYQESFSRNDRNANKAELISALAGRDAERASASLSTLIQQGGISEALEALSSSGLDWSKMNGNVKSRIVQTMGVSGVGALKGYSKYQMSGGGASFKDWSSATINAAQAAEDARVGVKKEDSSYANYLMSNGLKAMNSYTKDEMQFIENNSSGIRAEMGNDTFGSMLGNVAIYGSDPKAQTVAEQIIANELSNTDNNRMTMENLNLTPEMIGNMREQTAAAIFQGELNNVRGKNSTLNPAMYALGSSDARRAEVQSIDYVKKAMFSAFEPQAKAISMDSRIKNRMNSKVGNMIGVK